MTKTGKRWTWAPVQGNPATAAPSGENAADRPLRAIAEAHGLGWPDVEPALQAAFQSRSSGQGSQGPARG